MFHVGTVASGTNSVSHSGGSVSQWNDLSGNTQNLDAVSGTLTTGVRTQNLLNVMVEDVSLDTRQNMEGYLAHKWGLLDNLPSDHPYKTTRLDLRRPEL